MNELAKRPGVLCSVKQVFSSGGWAAWKGRKKKTPSSISRALKSRWYKVRLAFCRGRWNALGSKSWWILGPIGDVVIVLSRSCWRPYSQRSVTQRTFHLRWLSDALMQPLHAYIVRLSALHAK